MFTYIWDVRMIYTRVFKINRSGGLDNGSKTVIFKHATKWVDWFDHQHLLYVLKLMH